MPQALHGSNTWQPLGALKKGARGLIKELSMPETLQISTQADSFGLDIPPMAERLRELGFSEGLTVELLYEAPLGRDPIAVRVGAMTVALRRADANMIKVEIL